jgi:TolB protein
LTDTRTSLNAGGPWSPDGTEIAYRSERLGSSDVWVTSADGQRSRVIAGGPSADYGHAWSPDGKWMAFFSNRNGLLQLFRVPATGGEPERLNDGDTGSPVWSLDGKDIFYSGRRERAGDFWAWSVAARNERRITDFAGRRGALVTQPPSTDGKYIYFAWREDLGDIWVMDAKY